MKIRQDFVSNSSSSSYIVTGIDSLDNLKNAICDALSDDRNERYADCYDKEWYKDLRKDNIAKLNLYLSDTTAVFYSQGISNPIGIETSIVNRFVKDGIIIDEEKLEKFINFINKRYDDYMDGVENEYEFERELKESVSFRFIGNVTKDSIAILKWLKDHDKLFTRQKFIDDCKQALDNGWWTQEIYDKEVARVDEFQKENDDEYNRIINAFDEGKPMIYVHINRDGDGMDGDRLFAIGYVGYAKEKGLKIITSECF